MTLYSYARRVTFKVFRAIRYIVRNYAWPRSHNSDFWPWLFARFDLRNRRNLFTWRYVLAMIDTFKLMFASCTCGVGLDLRECSRHPWRFHQHRQELNHDNLYDWAGELEARINSMTDSAGGKCYASMPSIRATVDRLMRRDHRFQSFMAAAASVYAHDAQTVEEMIEAFRRFDKENDS